MIHDATTMPVDFHRSMAPLPKRVRLTLEQKQKLIEDSLNLFNGLHEMERSCVAFKSSGKQLQAIKSVRLFS